MSQGPHSAIATAIAMAIEPTLRTIVREEVTRLLAARGVAVADEPRPAAQTPRKRRSAPVLPSASELTLEQARAWLDNHGLKVGRKLMRQALKSRHLEGRWKPDGGYNHMGCWSVDVKVLEKWARSLPPANNAGQRGVFKSTAARS
jgi:hypothetical protein